MRQRFFLSMLAMILAFAQVWAAPVDSLRINPRTTSLPNHLNSVELTDGDVLLNGLTPGGKGVDLSGVTTYSDPWKSLPSTKTFKTKVGQSVSYTITVNESSYANSSGCIATKYDARLDDATGMYTLSVQTYDEQGYFNSPSDFYYSWKKVITVVYNPTARGTHEAKLIVKKNGGLFSSGKKTIKLQGTAIDPSISVSPSSLTFSDATVGTANAQSFRVTGTDLTGNLTVTSSNPNFTVSPTTLTASGGSVTVIYKPTATGTHVGTITISGCGATSKTVSVKGTCTTSADPTIKTSVTAFTFGTVIKGNTATKTFTVTGSNTTGSLTVSSSNSNFTVSPTTLPAGGGTVTVTYKPTDAGSHSSTITISGGGAASAKVTATGTCVNPPSITVNPISLAFGSVVKGKSSTLSFTVTCSNLTGNLTVSSNNSNFTVSPTTLPASGGTVTVTYKPTAAGSHSGTITISGGGASSKIVSVTGTCVVPTISTGNTTALAFGTVVKGKTASKTFTVTGTNLTGSLTLSSGNSNFTVSPTTITAANAANGVTVTVTYKPSAAGSNSGTITISGGGAADKVVSVSGTCVVPTITVNPTSLAFGTVVKGNTVSKTFTVKGTYLTDRLAVSSSNSNFTVSPTTITASEAYAGATVTVTYKPTATGSHSGTITISGGGAASKTVSVSGKCVVPEITVSASSLTFASYNDSRTLTVKGTNLTGSLTLTTSGYFSVSPTTITVAEAKAGKTVVVQCTAGKNAQRATGVLTISGGGASAKKVTLTFDATSPVPYAPVVLPDEEESGDERNGGELQITQEVFGNSIADVNELVMDVKIYAEGGDIVIETPVEQSAVISDIAGRARRVNLQAGRNVVPVNASGVHIVRVGEKTAKLMLK